jgi:hypothetical protein
LKQERAVGPGQGGLTKLDGEHGEAKYSDDKADRTKDLPPIEPV